MEAPKISVIMAVYNTKEEWLREAVESILSQTFADFEFIIINDGSSNNAEDVILSYQDERIRYIKQENQGLANSLNNGLKIAKGEYIARMDSDDISLPERFEKQIKYFEKHSDVSVLGTGIERFPKKKIDLRKRNPKFADFLTSCCIAHPTVMFRRSDFEKYNLRYNPEYKCEDYELWSRAVRYLKFDNLSEILLKYRRHGENLSILSNDFRQAVGRVQKNMLEFLTDDEKLQEKFLDTAEKYSDNDKFIEKIFSIKNSRDGIYKKIRIFLITFKFKRV